MSTRLLNIIVYLPLMCVLFMTAECSESVHTKQVPKETLKLLEQKFLMPDALAIVKKQGDLKSVKNYFDANSDRYKHVASQKQGEMVVEGYSVLDLSSPIIGYSLFFHDASGSLVVVDTSVNPLNKAATKNAALLISNAFDSVETASSARLHFLGIHNLDSRRLLKIMVWEGKTSMELDYAIRYVISPK